MLCENCNGIDFQPLLVDDPSSVYHVLHRDRLSYDQSLIKRCQLCTLISSQLGNVDVQDDTCGQLAAFMVLKRRWPFDKPATNAMVSPISVLSLLGCAFLAIIDPLPSETPQYPFLDDFEAEYLV